MKFVIATLAIVISASAFASDKCRSAALSAAEDDYGNSPDKTIVKVIQPGGVYHVAVGINNPEDGEHDYEITFTQGCDSKPAVREMDRNEKF